MSGGTIAVIIMAVLAVVGLGGVFLLYRSRRSRHPIPHPVVAAVPNPGFLINMEDRARTGSVVVSTAESQIKYLIPMEGQAPGEYLVPVARNQDYTYAPPLQPPADYAVIDGSGKTIDGTAGKLVATGGGGIGGGGGGGGGTRKSGGGKDLDLNGYVVDESSAPVEPGLDVGGAVGKVQKNVEEDACAVVKESVVRGGSHAQGGSEWASEGCAIGNAVHGAGSDAAARNSVYSSYVEGSTNGSNNAAECGTPAECDSAVVDESVGEKVGRGIQRRADTRQGSVYLGFGNAQDEQSDL
jgi:hypothetical protein